MLHARSTIPACLRGLSVGALVGALSGCPAPTPPPVDGGERDAGLDARGVDADVSPDADDSSDAGPTLDAGPTRCLSAGGAVPGSDVLEDALGRASLTIDGDRDACRRTYSLASTAARRDALPGSPRVFIERDGRPTLRTGNDLFDALFALALDEVHEASVASISDGAFDGGSPLTCPEGGCFETGRIWTYVWTRDTSYSVDLSLAALDPTRALNSMLFKLSERRGGGGEQIVQDTGSGGSYPVSTDRVVWALGAASLLAELEGPAREAFRDRAFGALSRTTAHDREVIFDATRGLYRGETSFLDWREQTYPAFTAGDVAPIAESESLSTNVLHLEALRLLARLATERGETELATSTRADADGLAARITEVFWDATAGELSAFTPGTLDRAPVARRDLLATSLAILAGLVPEADARRALSAYPHFARGAPVIAPQQQRTAIYHNRAQWPFVTAYELLAAREARHAGAASHAVRTLVRGAALSLSNVENYEVPTGLPFVEDGAYSGPVVSSQRQLWSVAGYVAMVSRGLFGLEVGEDGLSVAPYLTRETATELFAGRSELALVEWPARGHLVTVVLHLPTESPPDGGEYAVGAIRLNGVGAVSPLAWSALGAESRIDVDLVASAGAAATIRTVDPSDYRDVFAPATPSIAGLDVEAGHLRVRFDLAGETASAVTVAVFRDGARIASGLTSASYLDTTVDAASARTPCYAIETSFASGAASQHSAPSCFWGPTGERVQTLPASSFTATGGDPVTAHGYFHYQGWGDVGDRLVVSAFRPRQDGEHLLQVRYGNGSGPISTGITCAVKRVVVEDEATGAIVGGGVLVMPQLGDWDRWATSSFVRVPLLASHTYRISLVSDDTTVNMSSFQHFARYTAGEGGASGVFERVNIAELTVLAL